MGAFLRSLEDLWAKGQLKDVEQDLDCFIRQNLQELRKTVREGKIGGVGVARRRYLKGEISDRQLVDYAVRTTLRRRGSCNPRRDIEEQRGEIEKEVWYEGERRRNGVPSELREEIARRWASQHASQWREWRLYQLLYVWERKAEEYLRLLSDPQA
jgi:hypothetical protein